MTTPDPLWVFRMVHVDNLVYILENGLYAGTNPERDRDYIFIGDSTLTQQRESFPIPVEGAGNIGDYVAFYFCARTPMLLNIKTGHRGVPKRPQSDIIYLCCRLNCLEAENTNWLFTDGHAKNSFSRFFTEKDDLDQVDWALRWEKYWYDTEQDRDRQRRKQAEFLVRDRVPPNCIERIVVFDKVAAEAVRVIVAQVNRNIEVYINPQGKFYY